MFFLKKMLSAFLVPPGLFVTLVLLLGLWLAKRSRVKESLAAFAVGLLVWGALTRAAGEAALRGLEYAYLPPAEVSADVIIVLGGGVTHGAPAGAAGPSLHGAGLERAAEAARLYARYKLPVIVSGGAVFGEPAESPVMKDYLASLGVPRDKVLTEERSRDTRENALFSKKLCDEKGYKRPVVVTSAYHMKRAVLCFEKAGFAELVPYPTAYRTPPARRPGPADLWPDTGEDMRRAAHERLGLLLARLAY